MVRYPSTGCSSEFQQSAMGKKNSSPQESRIPFLTNPTPVLFGKIMMLSFSNVKVLSKYKR